MSDNPSETKRRIAELLEYSMEDADWDFNMLSSKEQEIVETPDALDEIRVWAALNTR